MKKRLVFLSYFKKFEKGHICVVEECKYFRFKIEQQTSWKIAFTGNLKKQVESLHFFS